MEDFYPENYEEFKAKLMDDIKEKLADEGVQVEVDSRTTQKFDSSYDAIVVKPEDSNIGATLNAEALYEAFQDSQDYNEIMQGAVKTARGALDQEPSFDTEAFANYENVKDQITMEVVSKETNAEMLENMPHRDMEDMAIVYKYLLPEPVGTSRVTITVNDGIGKTWGVTEEQLQADALVNAPKIMPTNRAK